MTEEELWEEAKSLLGSLRFRVTAFAKFSPR